MKHTWKITAFLVLIFICAQIMGLAIINQYIDINATKDTGKTVVNEGAYNITGIAPPEVENESFSWIFILVSVLIGTALVLLIIRFRKRGIWKAWFFMSVIICLTVALAPFIKMLLDRFDIGSWSLLATLIVAGVFTFYKVIRPNLFIHNLTEIFIYGGLAALIVPVINMVSAVLLLIGISIYDMIAVWRSKHMVTMAKFQAQSQIFAGLLIPYKKPEKGMKIVLDDKDQKKAPAGEETTKSAILGGGDIAFPLLFAGVVMKTTASYISPLIIALGAAIALFFLLYKGETNKFYPAMPFISAGCFAGLGVVWLLGMI
jgi:presenilin-like A22 family membrane protease